MLSRRPDVARVSTIHGPQLELRPSRVSGLLWTGSFVWLGVFVIGVATWEHLRADPDSPAKWPAAVFCCVVATFGLGSFGFAAWNWRLRREPLVIDERGTVAYRGRELCAAGTAQSVRLKCDSSGDSNTWSVEIVTARGAVELPSPYFAIFSCAEEAQALAEHVAGALRVSIGHAAT